MIDDEEDEGKFIWHKKNESCTCSLGYVQYECGNRELIILNENRGSIIRNPTIEQLEEKIRWLNSIP